MTMHNPPHPGEFIRETYIEPFKISIRSLAKSLGVSPSTLARIVSMRNAVSPEMALRSYCLENSGRAKTNFLIHVRPQHQYVSSGSGELLVGELLSFERLESEFNEFLAHRGLKADNIRSPGKYRIEEYFDREMLDLVNSLYAIDFRLGAYEMI